MQVYTPPRATVQQVLHHTPLSASIGSNKHVTKVLQQLSRCRTAAMGYHVYRCNNESCSYIQYQYHSCRNRHCPGCGTQQKQAWIEARTRELLPVKYYHVVFTIPHELNSIVMGNRAILFKLILDASAQTLLKFGQDPKYLGATAGIISILHTWGQQLSFHPHVHCIVSGGGISADNHWKEGRKNDWRFLLSGKSYEYCLPE